jgi:uncharacterized membrane protein
MLTSVEIGVYQLTYSPRFFDTHIHRGMLMLVHVLLICVWVVLICIGVLVVLAIVAGLASLCDDWRHVPPRMSSRFDPPNKEEK